MIVTFWVSAYFQGHLLLVLGRVIIQIRGHEISCFFWRGIRFDASVRMSLDGFPMFDHLMKSLG